MPHDHGTPTTDQLIKPDLRYRAPVFVRGEGISVGRTRTLRRSCFFFAALFALALRRRISVAEYMVPLHFFAPQLQVASSSPPS